MKHCILAICDVEKAYAYRLMDFLNKKEGNPFIVQAFTTIEALVSYGVEHPIEILLISEGTMNDAVKLMNFHHIIVLSGTREKVECLCEKAIYKYQSSAMILEEVMGFYQEISTQKEAYQIINQDIRIIGVYSPIRRILKTSFALTLGQLLARESRVLYINLEDYSGFRELMNRQYRTDLADLLFYISQENKGINSLLESSVETLEGLDYIPPVASPLDLQCVTTEDWVSFLNEISHSKKYDVIILDIGESLNALPRFLSCCERIYTPYGIDVISNAKITQYEAFLEQSGLEDIQKKTKKLTFGFMKGLEYGPEHLMYSELGDYVQRMIEEERKEGFW